MTYRKLAAAFASMAIAGCATISEMPTQRVASTTLLTSNGQPVGRAEIVASGQAVSITIGLASIAEGARGIHLHTTGSCSGDGFAGAGGHLNPLGRRHGALADGGKHVGDLPNIVVRSGGTGTLVADIAGTPDEVRGWLFDGDGTAVVLHADADDYRTDPTGNSGTRVACGVLKPV